MPGGKRILTINKRAQQTTLNKAIKTIGLNSLDSQTHKKFSDKFHMEVELIYGCYQDN